MRHFYCVAFYEGDLSWVPKMSAGQYHVYAKTRVDDSTIAAEKTTTIENLGYNLYAYLRFTIDNYESLPDTVIYCKNNVFPRHVSRETFERLASRDIFTPIEEPRRWTMRFPVSAMCSDGGYLELNNSWYVRNRAWRYFRRFDDFYRFILAGEPPKYVRFAPGANYVVPKEHILLRSRNFYENLLAFCTHAPFAAEAFMLERALFAIWTSAVVEPPTMATLLSASDLDEIAAKARRQGVNPIRAFLSASAERASLKAITLLGQVTRA